MGSMAAPFHTAVQAARQAALAIDLAAMWAGIRQTRRELAAADGEPFIDFGDTQWGLREPESSVTGAKSAKIDIRLPG